MYQIKKNPKYSAPDSGKTHKFIQIFSCKSCFILLLLICLIILLDHAPGYLAYSDKPEKSDAIVLFVGPDSKKRNEEARLLLTEGFASSEINPAYMKVVMASPISDINDSNKLPLQKNKPNIKIQKTFENTHIEILRAKQMMDQSGYKTAIFVSSPYHMRRIKIIAEKIFDDPPYRIVFVPARNEPVHKSWMHITKTDLVFISEEYAKICWFMLYSISGSIS